MEQPLSEAMPESISKEVQDAFDKQYFPQFGAFLLRMESLIETEIQRRYAQQKPFGHIENNQEP